MISRQTIFRNFVLALGLFLAQHAMADTTVVFVRHGEKPAPDLGQLTCQGLNRALKLAPVLMTRFGKADEIFAPNPAVKIQADGIEWSYVRPLATIEPYAISIESPVNAEYGWNNLDPVVDRILAREEGLIVLAWEHHGIMGMSKALMKKLGADPRRVPVWRGDDFDGMFVFRIANGGANAKPSLISFERQIEGLDGQPTGCPQ